MLSVDAVLAEIAKEGYRVIESAHLPTGWWGACCAESQTIYVHPLLPDFARPATLLHELGHARRGDQGHQDPRVERRINRAVALRLVCPDALREAAILHAGHLGAIAAELEQPAWVIDTYRALIGQEIPSTRRP